jgi:hypothetical protein
MRMLPVAIIVGAFALGNSVSGQDNLTPGPRADSMTCVLPDRTEHAVNTAVTVDGRTYRCVEALDQDFQPRGVAWTPVSLTPKPTYTSEAMLKRIRGDSTATPDRADATNCVLPDKTEHAVTTAVTVDGRTYRCVEVLEPNVQLRGLAWARRGVAWTLISPEP